MLTTVDVISNDLHTEVGQRGCGALLGQKVSTYFLGIFIMVQFENNTFFHPINVAINCCKVPSQ